jgi:hypothetical protein
LFDTAGVQCGPGVSVGFPILAFSLACRPL